MSAIAVAAILAIATACGPSPESVIRDGELLLEMSDAVNDLREENAILQMQIDSLSARAARQDTLLARLANAAGMPIPPH
ncbi:MAG: hypothetical protein ACRENI_01145 [Gemmatimonadaceae bacterium]